MSWVVAAGLVPAQKKPFQFQLDPDCATFVATDAHRLVRYQRTEIKAQNPAAFILPKKALNLLKNSLPNTQMTLTFFCVKLEVLSVISRPYHFLQQLDN